MRTQEELVGLTNFYLTQVFTGHGCFKSYVKKYKINPASAAIVTDDAMHTLFECAAFHRNRVEVNKRLQILLISYKNI